MRQAKNDLIVLENKGQTFKQHDPNSYSNHEFPKIQENFKDSFDTDYNSKDSNNTTIVSTQKWQIMLTSTNCTIEKYCQGWKIYPNTEMESEENSKPILKLSNSLMITNEEPAKTANAEILCNRDVFDEEEGEDGENSSTHGRIVFREYLKLLPSEEEKFEFILKVVTNAVNEQKTFAIYGVFPVLRKPLGRRGWIEKRFIRRMLATSPDISKVSTDAIERLMRHPPNFIWYSNKRVSLRVENKTVVNKFSGCYFTSKVDMCNNLENVYWFYEAGVSNIQFPRCYNVYQPAQIEEFIQDFHITACMSTLKWFLFLASIAGPNSVWSEEGTVPLKAIFFALERCTEYISICMHEDIDRKNSKDKTSLEWTQFLSWHEQLLQRRDVLKKEEQMDIDEILKFTVNTMREMVHRRPQSRIDGMQNVWILKPGDKSLGRGIILKNSLREILNKINQAAKECMQYVVQKYIERPLLIHKTKIDIRQWFLITSTQPLTVWMYKDILVRFASGNFTLDDFHESIHLCNTTVQLKYRKTVKEDAPIPRELHWNLEELKRYLKSTNRESAWEKLIKPGIKQNLIGALLASQENMVNRKNSFQLYGADFLIMDDLSVWLIEINTNPRLHPPSSTITEKLYPEIIEDTIKVVIDRPKDKTAARGNFECIFKQRNPFYGNVFGRAASLGIRGKSLHTSQRNLSRKLSSK